jgi:hypothetical protein
MQQIYKEADEYSKLRVLADLEPQGLTLQMLGLEQEPAAMKPKPTAKPSAAQTKPTVAGAPGKTDADILSQYLPREIVHRMSKEVKDDLIRWVKNELIPVGNDSATITALLKTDYNVKKLMGESGASAAAQAPKPDIKAAGEKPRPVQAAGAPRQEVTILNARTQGDGIHAWDCTWESINNATNIYKSLKTNKAVAQDISNVAYVKGIPNMSAAEIQPLSDEMVKVINTNNLIPKDDYTFIEAEGGVLDPAFVALSEGAPKLKNSRGAVHAFIINTGGHWYTVVAHNNQGKLNYYIANDIPKKGGLKDYKEIIDFLKKLIE